MKNNSVRYFYASTSVHCHTCTQTSPMHAQPTYPHTSCCHSFSGPEIVSLIQSSRRSTSPNMACIYAHINGYKPSSALCLWQRPSTLAGQGAGVDGVAKSRKRPRAGGHSRSHPLRRPGRQPQPGKGQRGVEQQQFETPAVIAEQRRVIHQFHSSFQTISSGSTK